MALLACQEQSAGNDQRIIFYIIERKRKQFKLLDKIRTLWTKNKEIKKYWNINPRNEKNDFKIKISTYDKEKTGYSWIEADI